MHCSKYGMVYAYTATGARAQLLASFGCETVDDEQEPVSKGGIVPTMPMAGATHYQTDRAKRERYLLRWPETGGIKVLIDTVLLVHLVLVATPKLTEQLSVLNPAIVPEPFTTILHGALWLGVVAVVAWLFRSKSLVSTYRFDGRDEIEHHFERDQPNRRRVLQYAGAAVFGGVLAWIAYGRFVATFLNVIDLLVIVVEQFTWVITVTDGLYAVVFLVSFMLFAIGVDRLVVSGLRWLVRRRYESY